MKLSYCAGILNEGSGGIDSDNWHFLQQIKQVLRKAKLRGVTLCSYQKMPQSFIL